MNINMLDLVTEDYKSTLSGQLPSLDALKNSVVVITGGTGFMGTWLAGMLAYLNDHHYFNTEVYLVARNTEQFRLTRPHLSQRSDIKLITSDIRNLVELPPDTTWVIHCAATPNSRFHASNPIETMSIIGQGTLSLMRAAERCSHLKMILNISSGLIYGSQPFEQETLMESCNSAPKCNTVSSAYAEAKRYAETLCSAARSQARIPVITVRPFAFIGPYQPLDAPWALNNFIHDALSGNPIRVLGDGKTIRSYLYASDMAFWLLKILTCGNSGEIYNMGSSDTISLHELASKIAAEFRPNPEIHLGVATIKDLHVSRFVPDVSLAKCNLQLEAQHSLDHAIRRTILWNQLNVMS